MMQVLTPSGYRDAATLAPGDKVSAFDLATGAPIVNTIETLQWVDAETFRDWQNPVFLINGEEHFGLHSLYVLCPPRNAPQPVMVRDLVVGNQVFRIERGDYVFDYDITSIVQVDPYLPFRFLRINGSWTLNSEQSIWRNGDNVYHARDLIIGDVIYDDADHDVTITSIEEVTADGWWRFDISGDHSYIVDGLTYHNASRFWVGGAGTWDLSTTTHWAASSGSTGGQSAPGSADTVTIDASSGAGTVTPSLGGSGTFQSLTCGAMGMTLDFSVNNDNVTLSATSAPFSASGAGVRTLRLGNGTWTISGVASTPWSIATTTSLTFAANSSTIIFTGSSQTVTRTINWGALTYNNVQLNGTGTYQFGGQSATFNTLTLGAGVNLQPPAGQTYTVTSLVTQGTASSPNSIASSSLGSITTISCASGTISLAWCAFHDVTFSGGATFGATNSFDLGHNSGISISGPSGGTGAAASFSATIF